MMAYKSYPRPRPLSPEELLWFQTMIRLQANVQDSDKRTKKKKSKEEKR